MMSPGVSFRATSPLGRQTDSLRRISVRPLPGDSADAIGHQ